MFGVVKRAVAVLDVRGGVAKRLLGCVMVSALVAFSIAGIPCAASSAFAEDGTGQAGSGQSDLVLRLKNMGEYGGIDATGEFANPDNDGDGLGDNLAFTVPTRIDFTVLPDGTLIGPSPETIYIENESVYDVHVSSLRVSALGAWNIVSDAGASSQGNCVDLTIGPEGDLLSAASYLDKAPVSKPAQWNMTARTNSNTSDRVPLNFLGQINNVSVDLTKEATFGQIEWFVTPGRVA